MRYDMENCDETLTLWGRGEGERERERERSLGFQIWGFGRENERAVGLWDEIYIQNYISILLLKRLSLLGSLIF